MLKFKRKPGIQLLSSWRLESLLAQTKNMYNNNLVEIRIQMNRQKISSESYEQTENFFGILWTDRKFLRNPNLNEYEQTENFFGILISLRLVQQVNNTANSTVCRVDQMNPEAKHF
jgi:hypothetical protein